jgi:hypothetical protein
MTTKRKTRNIKIRIPVWAASLYICSAIILLPWTIYLGASLPTHHLSAHWDISWTGLDIGLIITMLATGILAYRKSRWLVITSSMVGSLLLVDAWFDVMSERRVSQFYQSLFLAIFIEIPMAITSYYVACKVLKNNI